MSEPTEAEMAKAMALGAKITLAFLDGDEDQVARLVNPDVYEAVLSLSANVHGLAVRCFGPDARAVLHEVATYGELADLSIEEN